ncbi:MAG: putative signal transduction histidine kinase [Ferruginibacter sp.]|nr:putative signal transduction histidine kinase [Ferruginibacter sp.]
MIRFILIIFFLFIPGWSFAQLSNDSNSIDISTITESQLISDRCMIYVDSTGKTTPENITKQAWQPLTNFNLNKYIPNSWITKPIFLKFTLENRGDSLKKIYFITGTYVRRMDLFKLAPNGELLQLENESRRDGFQPIDLKGKGKQEFITSFNFTKRNLNYIIPQVVNDDYLIKFKKLRNIKNDSQLPIGFLLSGVLLMMIFFTAANYFQTGRKEFLYNCCYSFCMFSLVFLNTLLEKKSGLFSSLFHEYLDFVLLASGTVFYIAFTRKFLETRANYPLLNKIFVLEEKVVMVVLVIFTFVVFFTNNFQLQKSIENGLKLIVLVIGIVYIVIALAQKNSLMNYLAVGNAILIFFSIISFLLILFPFKNTGILTSAMIYYEVGIVCELIFFLLGLSYKNRVELIEKIKEQESLKREAEKQSYETKLAVLNAQQNERNRISADMHDDLGAGVTAIRLYSELAKKRIGKEVIPEIEKISSSANELLNNMNAIIWTMSSSNDSLDNMVAYIRGYALEYFENTGINCHIYLEENLPKIAVSGEIRRNIYLVVKEALNNILKHSGATDVSITLKRESGGLTLYIQDNGKGIDFENLRRFGNGLINMKKRMEATRMYYNIENNNGTLITLHSKLEF